jgi:chemotaxis protein methyltransferase CheR
MCLPDTTFQFFRRFIREHSAIVVDDDKMYLVEARLTPVAEECGLSSLDELAHRLRSEPFGAPHRAVVNAITTNETSFFRDRHPFDTLSALLPTLIEQRSEERALRIWCAGSSSGQEPYSIAMLLLEHFPRLAGWSVDLLGTDISGQMIARAQKAAYSQLEVNRGLPAALLVKYFEQDGHHWRLRTDVRRMVRFAEHNLSRHWPPPGPWDIVFLRNVLIYFDVDTKRSILARVRRVLDPRGYLFLGGAETTLNLDDKFERVAVGRSACYRTCQARASEHRVSVLPGGE